MRGQDWLQGWTLRVSYLWSRVARVSLAGSVGCCRRCKAMHHRHEKCKTNGALCPSRGVSVSLLLPSPGPSLLLYPALMMHPFVQGFQPVKCPINCFVTYPSIEGCSWLKCGLHRALSHQRSSKPVIFTGGSGTRQLGDWKNGAVRPAHRLRDVCRGAFDVCFLRLRVRLRSGAHLKDTAGASLSSCRPRGISHN